MPNLNKLYPEGERQKAFIDHKDGMLVSLAGPGTGKTFSLLLRIQELTENRHVDSSSICYLTFIKEIVRAFENDLYSKYPGATVPQGIKASTLHSLACRLIRNQGHKKHLGGHLCILDLSSDKDRMAKIAVSDITAALSESGIILTDSKIRKDFKIIKTGWQSCKAIGTLTSDCEKIKRAYDAYSRVFKILDWDEVIPFAILLYVDEKGPPDWI